ncbi:MAG: hypothetical protein IJ558_05985 [Treponema sp.]|nr:hypothetical protein [Treponema sp.]
MKKLLLAFILFFTFSHSFAEFNDGTVTKFVEFNLASTTNRGIEQYNTLYSVEAGFISRWLDGLAGVQGYEDVFDCTIATVVWFPFTSWQFETAQISLGAGALYHFERYKDISSEHDILFDSTFRYQNARGWSISFRGGYSFKKTKVDALSRYLPYLTTGFPTMGMIIDKVWQNGFELYFEHALHDLYRYPHFACPHYTLGAAVNMDSGLRLGGDVSMRIVDQYTTSPYVDSLIFKMTARMSF